MQISNKKNEYIILVLSFCLTYKVLFSQTYVEQTGMRNSGTGYKGATSYILTQCNNRHSFLCKIQRCLTSKANSVSLHCVCTARCHGCVWKQAKKVWEHYPLLWKIWKILYISCSSLASFRLSVSSSSRKTTGRKDSVPLFSFFEPWSPGDEGQVLSVWTQPRIISIIFFYISFETWMAVDETEKGSKENFTPTTI